MARLELAIAKIVEVYSEYADSGCKLNKQAMKNMMDKEVQCPELKTKVCSGDCDKAMKLKLDQGGEIDFKEFMNCLTLMCKCYYQKKTGKKCEDHK